MDKMTYEQAMERIAQLEAAQRKQATSRLTVKLSAKGAVSVYGLQRWPVTLYAEQWARLIEFVPNVVDFVNANRDSLATKDMAVRLAPGETRADSGAILGEPDAK